MTIRLLVTSLVLTAVYCHAEQQGGVRSPLLQVWGVNLAGIRPLSSAEVWGTGVSKSQSVRFDPDEGYRLRSSYEQRYGPGGQYLIDLAGKGKHIDQAARELDIASYKRSQKRRSYK